MAKISEFLTIGEASAYLGVSKVSLRRWDRAGMLKARRHPISGYRLYLRSELDGFLSQLCEAEQPADQPSRTSKRVIRTRA